MLTKRLPKKYVPVIFISLALLILTIVSIVYGLDQKMDFLWNNKADVATSTAETIDTIDTSNWKTYRNEEYGFEFKYPGSWTLEEHYSNSISFYKAETTSGSVAVTKDNPESLDIEQWWNDGNRPPAEHIYYINGIKMLSRDDLTKKAFGSDLILINFTKGQDIYELEWLVDPRGAFEYLNNPDNADQKYKISHDEFIDIISTFKFFK